MRGSHCFAIFRAQILQSGDSSSCGGEGRGRVRSSILPCSKMVIPPRVAEKRGGDAWESPFCHFQNPPEW